MSNKTIIFNSADGELFEVEEAVALQSQTIKHMIEDECAENPIPLPNVSSATLAKVIEYCKKHAEPVPEVNVEENIYGSTENAELNSWDEEFVKVDQTMLFDLILAANYLNIGGLLDLLCKTVADMMKGKTPEKMREIFHIKNDYTAEEEAEVRKENAWAFE